VGTLKLRLGRTLGAEKAVTEPCRDLECTVANTLCARYSKNGMIGITRGFRKKIDRALANLDMNSCGYCFQKRTKSTDLLASIPKDLSSRLEEELHLPPHLQQHDQQQRQL